MKNKPYIMRDPTAELTDVLRDRLSPSKPLTDAVIGLLSISKERSDDFMDLIECNLESHGYNSLRFRKPTYTRPAPLNLLQEMSQICDVTVIGLAD